MFRPGWVLVFNIYYLFRSGWVLVKVSGRPTSKYNFIIPMLCMTKIFHLWSLHIFISKSLILISGCKRNVMYAFILRLAFPTVAFKSLSYQGCHSNLFFILINTIVNTKFYHIWIKRGLVNEVFYSKQMLNIIL